MTDKRISELTSATSLGDADVFPIVQSGETKKLTGSAVKSYAQSGVVLASEKGANSGVATLGSDGKLTASQLPDLAVSDYLGSVASQTAMLALTGQKGDWCTRSDLGTTWVISGVNPASISSWTELNYPTAPVTSVAGKTGAVSLVKGDVGLGNVDNTSDANKPISSATQTALDGKQTKITASGITKGDGNGGITAATAGTDYLAPSAVGSTIVAQTGTNGAAQLPSGSTAQRPGTPTAGYIRYNATTGKFEGYGSAWGNIGGGAFIGDTAPANPGAGDLWWNSATGHTFVYYGSAWVDLFGGAEGQYLPLTGGTISGALSVTGNTGIGTSSFANGKLYVLSGSDGQLRLDATSGGQFTSLYYNNNATGKSVIRYDNTNNLLDIYNFTAGGKVTISTGSAAPAATFDSSGNLGLGVTPSAWGSGFKGVQLSTGLSLMGSNVNGNFAANCYFDGTNWKYVQSTFANNFYVNYGNQGSFVWAIGASGTAGNTISFTQAMTLRSDGILLAGKTDPSVAVAGHRFDPTGEAQHVVSGGNVLFINRTTNDGSLVTFYRDGSPKGSISVSGNTVSYNTSSDQRLKTNIAPAGSALQSILNFPVDKFDWIADGSHQDFGAVAQKAINFIPEIVSVPEDPKAMWGIDWSKANPRLIRAFQELEARVATLEARVH